MSLHLFFLYLVTWSLVALSPGPAVMCSMAQATRYGFRSSLLGISGIQTGNLLFFVCIAFGLGTLLSKATAAFNTLRLVGAIYLLYLGAKIIFQTLRRKNSPSATADKTVPVHRNLFFQGLLIQLTNPKALLFVSALLPQFMESERPIFLQLIILVITTVVVDAIVLSGYAFCAERGAKSFKASRFGLWLERAFGATLVFFGLRLLLSRK